MQAKTLLGTITATLVLILAFIATTVEAGQVRLSWNAPTTDEDGTPLTDFAGYILYYGRTSRSTGGNYDSSVDVGNQTSYTLSGLEDGQVYFFSITAYDTSDNESNFSNEVSATAVPEPTVPGGLVAAYALNEGSGTTAADSSDNRNTLALSGATWTTSGKNGRALSFNGTGYADAPNSTSLNITGNALTIEAWANPTTLSGDTHLVSKIVQAGQHNNPYFSYSLHVVSGNTPRFWVTTGGVGHTVESSVPLTTNTWAHIVGTYDGTTIKIYVNGTLTGSASATGAINGYAGPLRLAANGSEGEVWNGKIDEVRIYNRALTVSEIQTDMNTSITPPPIGAPVAAFSGSPRSGSAPLAVHFTDASSGSITGWSWNFGDGGTSTAQSPSHTYASAGSYTVSLTVTGPGGSTTATQTGYITVTSPSGSPPVAAFSGSPRSGSAPLAVQFTDASSGSITGWSWNFGDGGTSTAQSPSHTYASAGSYTVSLTVTGPGGSTTATQAGYITVTSPSGSPPVAAFSGSPRSGSAPLAVHFTDASSGSITGWSWNFGDGGTSTAQSPSHTYASAGSYTVSLTVTGPGGSDSEVKANYVVVAASTTGLVAAYALNEGSGTTTADSSGNGNTGTLKNGPAWTTGKMGKALSFDGVNDYTLVSNSPSLNIAGTKITISLWVNITDRSNVDMVLIGKPWASSAMTYPYYQYGVEFDANGAKTLDFYFGDTSGTLRGPFSMQPAVGVWTYVAFTYDGTAAKGYLNGIQRLSVPVTQSIQARGNSLRIGVDGEFSQAFKGKIDQVRIYNRALTATEIQADMNTAIR